MYNCPIIVKQIVMNLATLLKQQEIISIRDFIQKLSKITNHPTSKVYTLVKNGKKVGTYIPEQYEDEWLWPTDQPQAKPYQYTSFFDDYDKIAFSSDDQQLSQHIDQILYGKK